MLCCPCCLFVHHSHRQSGCRSLWQVSQACMLSRMGPCGHKHQGHMSWFPCHPPGRCNHHQCCCRIQCQGQVACMSSRMQQFECKHQHRTTCFPCCQSGHRSC